MTIQQARQNGGPSDERGQVVDLGMQTDDYRETERGQQSKGNGAKNEQLARALGWFSIGLGLTQVMAPRSFSEWIGVSDDGHTDAVLRLVGLREIASGVGILTQPSAPGWLWARVGGDVMDLVLLGAALNSDRVSRDRVAAAMAAVVSVTALDLLCGEQLSQGHGPIRKYLRIDQGTDVRKSITINRSPEELYRFWRDFQNLPTFMLHLESVQVTEARRSHWKAKAPAGTTVEWDAEIIEDSPNELIAWHSLPGADVTNAGSVRFVPAPGGRGTEVYVEMQYRPPGGVVGTMIAKLFGEEPGQQVQEDLRRFKQVMETGEVVLSEATIAGRRLMQPAAQPPADLLAVAARA